MQVMFTAIIQGGGLPGQLGPSAKEEELYLTGFFARVFGTLSAKTKRDIPSTSA
jgi:hypothetical protein